MPQNLNAIAVSSRFDTVVEEQLVQRVIALLPSGSLLPPPTIICLRSIGHRGAGAAFCEVTGCLDPNIRPSLSVDITSFREWALANPRHPIAVRYQPLSAWLQAAHCDRRFLGLAEEFIQRERARLRSELKMAVNRLSGTRLTARRSA